MWVQNSKSTLTLYFIMRLKFGPCLLKVMPALLWAYEQKSPDLLRMRKKSGLFSKCHFEHWPWKKKWVTLMHKTTEKYTQSCLSMKMGQPSCWWSLSFRWTPETNELLPGPWSCWEPQSAFSAKLAWVNREFTCCPSTQLNCSVGRQSHFPSYDIDHCGQRDRFQNIFYLSLRQLWLSQSL